MSTTTPLQIPAQLGRYRIVKKIGEGGMGAVYLARDTQLDRDVALKVPQFRGQESATLLERFFQEARAAATVQHPNICPIYDFGEIDGVHYLTMAYIDGQPLEKWASGEKALTPRQIAALVRKVAATMQEAHKKGVIHRDLKPANIMIDRRGEPIVMDFGLARRVREGDQRLTQSGAIMGSPAYMPPEQVKGEQKLIGPASDVYALGVILYELLTYRLPFQGEDNLAVLAQVLMDVPPAPSSLRPDLEPALEAICLKAMAKKIEDRYPSMADMAAALLDYMRGGASPPTPPSSPRAPTATVPPAVGPTPPAGMRISQMGGLRSMARMPAPVPAADKTPSVRRPQRRRERPARPPVWPWVAGGAATLGLLALVIGLIAFRSKGDGTIRTSVSPAGEKGTEVAQANPGTAATPTRPAEPSRPAPSSSPLSTPTPRAGPPTTQKPSPTTKPTESDKMADALRLADAKTKLDTFMQKFGEQVGASAGVLAIEKNGVPLYSRGYGFSDKLRRVPTTTDTLFPVTHGTHMAMTASVRQLAASKGFGLNDPIMQVLKVTPRGKVADPRATTITVQHCIDNSTGWDDEIFKAARAEATKKVGRNPSAEAILGVLVTLPLREAPGSKELFCIFNFELLCHIITKFSGLKPADYYRTELLGREVPGFATAGTPQSRGPVVWNAENGFVCASAKAVLEVMRHYTWYGFPAAGWTGSFGWHNASLTYHIAWRGDGLDVVAMFNASLPTSEQELRNQLGRLLDTLKLAELK
ncbi:MAG: protein kinase domain-containing protein [Gemmataceae bacterium]